MKTPDEIKKGLGCCTIPVCAECPYDSEASCVVKNEDALAYIQQLEAENTRRHEKIIQLYNRIDEILRITQKVCKDAEEKFKQLEADNARLRQERDAACLKNRSIETMHPYCGEEV